jgi:ABC-type transport system involved in cytochrome bd biosynthesis fused ATPase/permease subunit
MAAQTTFRQSRMSAGVVLALVALAAAFLLGGASGYLFKAWTVPAATSTQIVTIPPATPQRTILPNQA